MLLARHIARLSMQGGCDPGRVIQRYSTAATGRGAHARRAESSREAAGPPRWKRRRHAIPCAAGRRPCCAVSEIDTRRPGAVSAAESHGRFYLPGGLDCSRLEMERSSVGNGAGACGAACRGSLRPGQRGRFQSSSTPGPSRTGSARYSSRRRRCAGGAWGAGSPGCSRRGMLHEYQVAGSSGTTRRAWGEHRQDNRVGPIIFSGTPRVAGCPIRSLVLIPLFLHHSYDWSMRASNSSLEYHLSSTTNRSALPITSSTSVSPLGSFLALPCVSRIVTDSCFRTNAVRFS